MGVFVSACVCVCAECMPSLHNATHMGRKPDSQPGGIFRCCNLLSNSSLSHSVSAFFSPMVYIPFTDSICLLELFTFFRDTVIH